MQVGQTCERGEVDAGLIDEALVIVLGSDVHLACGRPRTEIRARGFMALARQRQDFN